MKVIDLTPELKNGSSGFFGQLSRIFKPFQARPEEAPAQERVIASLQKALGNQYVLVRQAELEGLEVPIPLVLVGPTGVRVLYASGVRGVYRAREEGWERLDERQHKYRPVRPNLLTRVGLMGRAVQAYLAGLGQTGLDVEPVLIFSDAGIHLESARPAVRLVMADAMDRFIAGVLQSRILLDQEQVERVVGLLTGEKPGLEGAGNPQFEQDAFSYPAEPRPRPKTRLEQAVTAREQAFLARLTRLPFTGRQWLILVVIVLVNILLLAALVLLVLFST
jgi:hypothetical protein